jgi:hypothetical protein
LEVSGASPFNDAGIDIASCNQMQAQVFWPYGIPLSLQVTLPSSDDSGASPLCLAHHGAANKDTPLDIEPCAATDAQGFTGTLDNQLSIPSTNGNVCIDVLNVNPQLHQVHLWSCSTGASQRWAQAQPPGGGTALVSYLYDGALSVCIAVEGGQAVNMAPVDLEDCNNGPAQTWRMLLAVH